MAKLEVRARADKGFYRLGRHWKQDPEVVEVSEQEASVLRNEAQLIVRDVQDAPARRPPAAADEKKPAPPADEKK